MVVSAGYSRSENSGAKTNGNTSVADGNGHHVAFTVHSSALRIYVDGALQASAPWIGSFASLNDNGEVRLGGPSLLNGELDEITVWNFPLSLEELQFYKNRSLAGTESGLVAYYRCDETNGTLLA